MSGFGNQPRIFQQGAFGWGKSGFVELAFQNPCNGLIAGSLGPQEVGVAVESIRAAVQVGNITSNHLLVAAGEMAFGKVNRV